MAGTVRIKATPKNIDTAGKDFARACFEATSSCMESSQQEAERRAPHRTGRLSGKNGGESSIHYDVSKGGNIITGTLSATSLNPTTGENYAQWLSEGTGIYGPHGKRITPKKPGGLLVWLIDGSPNPTTPAAWKDEREAGNVAYAKSTKGMEPNPFMEEGLEVGWEKAPAIFDSKAVEFNKVTT